MAIASVSGGSNAATAPVRTNTELVKREEEDSEEKASKKAVAAQKNDDERSKKAVNEEIKGVKEVDTKA